MKQKTRRLRVFAAMTLLLFVMGLLAQIAQAAPTHVPNYTFGVQQRPSIATSPSGRSVITYRGFGSGYVYGFYARVFDGSGTPVSDEFLVTTSTDSFWADVAMDDAGNFVIVWDAQTATGYDILAQRYNSSGVAQGAVFRANDLSTGNQRNAHIAMNGAGNFVITWEDQSGRDGDLFGIYMRRFGSSGSSLSSDVLVNTNTRQYQLQPDVTMNASGSFVIVWADANAPSTKVQRYSNAGIKQGAETSLSNRPAGSPSIAMDNAGNFVVAFRNGDRDSVDAQRFDSAGVAKGGSFLVSTSSVPEGTAQPQVAMDASGNFVITYDAFDQNSPGFYAHRYRSDGSEAAVHRIAATTQAYPCVALDDAGSFILAWESANDSGDPNVYAERFTFNFNTAPTTKNSSESTREDTPVSFTLGARDEEGRPLNYYLGQPSKGTLSGTAPNLIYTPNPNVSGSDSFLFRVTDGTLESNISTVRFAIQAINDAPVASAQSVTTPVNKPVGINLLGSDVDNAALSYTIVSGPSHGTLSSVGKQRIYTPAAGYSGPDSFTFRVSDGYLNSNTATVNITVNASTRPNTAPITKGVTERTIRNTPLSVTLSARDAEGDALTYIIVSQPEHGTLSGDAPNLIYTPNSNYVGGDFFTFKVNDGKVDSNTSRVGVTTNR